MKTVWTILMIIWTLPTGWSGRQYTNPVGDGLQIADPFVLQYQGHYYLYGTSAGDGFKAWKSDNLVDWRPVGYVYRRMADSWGTGSYWAPEVVCYNGDFYMVFSCKGPEGSGLRLALAVSDSPEGPFLDLQVPWFDYNYSCIDGHLFMDTDGTPYLYFEKVGSVGEFWNDAGYLWGMIFGVKLSPDLLSMTSEPVLCLYPDQPWEHPQSMHARSVEGMTVFKSGNLYYMTYSANHYSDPDYGIGYATATGPLGMWTKSDRNPIMAKDLEAGVSGPGHNCITRSPDGKEWFIVYHSHFDVQHPSGNRVLNIDRLLFDTNGNLRVLGPSRSPQPFPTGTYCQVPANPP
jgi:beta-xylosidase